VAEPIRKLSKAKKSEAVSLGELIHQAVRVAIERAVHEELGQWKTIRTTNVIERLNEEFRRRVKTQGSLPGEGNGSVGFRSNRVCDCGEGEPRHSAAIAGTDRTGGARPAVGASAQHASASGLDHCRF
jgi:hypothetical protein